MAAAAERQMKANEIASEDLKSQVDQLDKDLQESEKRADEAEKQEDKLYDDFAADMKKELASKFNAFTAGTRGSVNIDHLHSQLLTGVDDQRTSVIMTKQTDVLRTNKVIRDISRALGTDWKGMFRYLMAAKFSKEEIDKHVEKIEKQSMPMTQAYKALLVWRDTKDEEMGLTQLADSLRIDKKEELADYVLDTLECEGDALFKLNLTAKGDISKKPEEGEAKAEEKTNGEAGAKPKAKPPLQKTVSSIGVLDDRKFLQLAKKIGSDWKKVATTLGLAEEDINEILESEGETYQGSFKMLWTWRDRTIELDQDNALVLREALKTCGKDDAALIV